MAVVGWRDGQWEIGNLLTTFEAGWILTWVFQVMPIFFFVGGFSNGVTLDAMSRRGAGFAEFARTRTWRLVKPVTVLLAVWLPLATVTQLSGALDPGVLRQATTVVTQPLWFIGIYLIVTALAPPMRLLHRRWGTAVPVALVLAAVLVDTARFALGVGGIGYLNFAFVWLLAHQLGFFYGDGRLQRIPGALLVIVMLSALLALVALTTWGPYPRSMVGLPGEEISNMNPPTICLVAVTVAQVAALMVVRTKLAEWLERPRVWGTVIFANMTMMTMFLWHLTALMIATVALLPAGFPQPTAGSLTWWLLRPAWVAILGGVTAAFVLLLSRFERPGPARQGQVPGNTVSAALAATCIIVGVCGFAVSGLVDFVQPNGRHLLSIPVSPLINVAALVLGGVLFAAGRRRPAQA